MKAITLTIFLLSGFATPLFAQENTQSAICPIIGELAETVMRNRQNGVSLSEMMGVANNADGVLQPVIREMVLEAYDGPRYSVPDNQDEAVQDFRNDIELVCYQGG